MELEPENPEITLAAFSDRVVAFSIDIALLVAGYFLTLKFFFPAYSVWANPHSPVWAALWTALFFLYQAYSSSEGRVSLGKALLGLRVVNGDNEALSCGQAAIRSVLYLLSSVLELGFVWALFNPARQCWHDLIVGSLVVHRGERSASGRALARLGAAGCLSFFAALWYWNVSAAPRYDRIMDVAFANVGAQEIGTLQALYHHKHGRYAESLEALAPLTGAPVVFMQDMDTLFDRQAGVKIKTNQAGYSVSARAMDDHRTLIAFNGP